MGQGIKLGARKRAAALIDELCLALEPFAAKAERFADRKEGVVYIEVFAGDLHAAAAALAKALPTLSDKGEG